MDDAEYSKILDDSQRGVGRFLWHWALMEGQLRETMGAMLRISALEARILSVNIQLRDKIHILKTLATIRLAPPEAATFTAALDDVATLSGTRNMMAHEMFSPSDDGKGTEFLTVKARGRMKFPRVVWSRADFLTAYTKIGSLADTFREARNNLVFPETAEVSQPPNALLTGLGLGSPLPLQLQGLLGGHPANLKEDDETPPHGRE